MKIEYVHFYVQNSEQWRGWFVDNMGFQPFAQGKNSNTQTEVVSSGTVKFFLSSPRNAASPVANYLRHHPPGVADIAFGVNNLAEIFAQLSFQQTKVIQFPHTQVFAKGRLISSQIQCEGGLRHTLIQREGITPEFAQPGLTASIRDQSDAITPLSNFTTIDHLVLNVAVGHLKRVVQWYETVLGFERQQSFQIGTERSGLSSQVLVHAQSGIQLPVNEPIGQDSQIQEFLDLNCGAGIQHLALSTPNIISAIAKLRQAGIPFLPVPSSYYEKLWQDQPKIHLLAEEWDALVQQQILIDCQTSSQQSENGQFPVLLQIFTEPIFQQPTFFLEFIERRQQAPGFGEGNFRALFKAIEREQLKRKSEN